MNSIMQNVSSFIEIRNEFNGLIRRDSRTNAAKELIASDDVEAWIMDRVYKLIELREKIAMIYDAYSADIQKIMADNSDVLYRKRSAYKGRANMELVLVDDAQAKIERMALMQGVQLPKNISAMCGEDTSETDLLASLLCDHDERYNMHTRFENILQSFELAEKRNDVETMNKLQPEIDFRMVGYNRLGDIIHDICKRTGKKIF